MHRAQPGNRGLVLDRDVSGQLRAVGDDHVIADMTIVRQMHIAHQEAVAADARRDRVRGATIDGRVLAHGGFVADVDPRFLASILQVLRIATQDRADADLHAFSEPHIALECRTGGDVGAVANAALRTDDRPRPDFDVLPEVRRRIDECRCMNTHRHRSRTIAAMSASVTTCPSTVATPRILHMVPRICSTSISIRN